MSIDFSTLQGLTIPEGVVTEIKDESGAVIWCALKEVAGTLYLRPSADISVGHRLYPADSPSAYRLIDEEVCDNGSTYIYAPISTGSAFNTSEFQLDKINQLPAKNLIVTSVMVCGDNGGSDDAYHKFILNVNGIQTAEVEYKGNKEFSISVTDAVSLINELLARNGVMPDIKLTVSSQSVTDGNKEREGKLSQVYVEINYTGYE